MKNDPVFLTHSKYDFTIIVVLSMAAVLASYGLEYFLAITPCRLCGIERYAYKASALIAIIGYFGGTRPSLIIALKYALIFIFGLGAVVSVYHSAIQHGWVPQPDFCSVSPMVSTNPSEVRAILLATDMPPPCNQVTFRFLTLSLAEWNIGLSLIFTGITTHLLRTRSV